MPTLKQITTRAKQIRKAKPRTKWQNAIKQASKELKAKYRKKEGKVGTKKKTVAKPKRKRVIARKKVGTTKRITGYSGWTIKGKHNIIYGVIYRASGGNEFQYITTSYRAAERYIKKQKFGYDAMYIKEFIV